MAKGNNSLKWQVYIILCSDGTLYTGITTDIERRMRQHAQGRGAKYCRGREPRRLLYLEGGHDRSSASKRELSIKRLTREQKRLLICEADDLTNLASQLPPLALPGR